MKWSLGINQQQAVELGLKNAQEAIILGMICDSPTWAEPVVIDGAVYYWTARQKIAEELPLLNLKPDSVYRALRSLVNLGLIEYRKSGVKDCTRLTARGKTYAYVGKKSEQAENSEKNPSKLGKKSENDSEKYPTYPSTNSHPSHKHPHLQEEEGVITAELVPAFDPFLRVPKEGIDGLSRDTIIAGVEHLVSANAGDAVGYRSALIHEILSGGGRTLGNIRRQRSAPRIGSNRGEPALPPGVNIFDLIEEWVNNDEGGAA